ncbi:hypothetical protein QBC40DRAFT_74816 [Triangularia verruculosa]|uniref:Uncharacterized protein n=1 Tax=Triangularia verruculosa TaxID=2587418 RepID=A0AAN7AZ36_9PEZI|nr:hypothetical protein QBC40DRAFT_74816 [Triangularia verruculosa]
MSNSTYAAPTAPSTSPAVPSATGAGTTRNAGNGPFPPTTAASGGVPDITPDIPICAILLALFIVGAATNMTIFQRNRRRSYKFFFSVLLFGFCMARIVALSMRIVWASKPKDVNVAIASQIFTAAGVLILFITNLVFAQRIIRAYHPFFGWSKTITWLFRCLFGSVIAILIMVITVTVQSFFTQDPKVRGIDRDIQLFCATYLAVFAFLPIPLVTLAAVVPRRTKIDKFGEGHFSTKFALLTFTALLLSAGAIFRAVIAYYTRPVADPAWYHGKAPYYCFNFGVELVVVYIYAISRFDKRFHIPDGSSAPGHYSCSDYGPRQSAVAAAVAAADFEKRSSYAYGKMATSADEGSNSVWTGSRYSTMKRESQSGRSLPSTGRPSMTARLSGSRAGPHGIGSSARSMRSVRSLYSPAATDENAAGLAELDGSSSATRAEDLAWMARAMVGFHSHEFGVTPLAPYDEMLRLDRPLPSLPPAPPPREYPPLLPAPEVLEPDQGYGYVQVAGGGMRAISEGSEAEDDDEERFHHIC